MSDTLFDLSRYKSASGDSDHSDWIDATGADPSWNEPSLAPTSALSINQLAHEWRSCAEFTITLESGQIVQGDFVPCLEGEHRMHQFDFTGPVSITGFKSHFVLAVEAEEYPHPRDYAEAYIQDLIARFEAAQQQQAESKKRARPVAEVETSQKRTADNDNFRLEPAMTENETTNSSHVPVEVVEELSPEEEADRQRLELKVERAFHESGKALTELRSRRLYRSTHKTFEEYCRDRFGFTRAAAYYLISAAEVMNNLISKCQQFVDILPTKENQCRPLTKLEPEEQAQVWQKAVEQVGGKVPPARIVKDLVMRHMGVVKRLKQKNPSPSEFTLGDVVEIKALKRSPLHPYNRMWGMIEHVGSFSYTVQVSIAKDVQQCKDEEMTRIDDEYTANIRAVALRIEWLVRNFELEPIEYDILANLQRSWF